MARTHRLSSSVVAAAIVLGSFCAAVGPAAAADPAPTTTPTTVLGTPPATPPAPTDEQIAAKQKALDAARLEAAAAAQAYTDAEARLGEIQAHVQDLEARIPSSPNASSAEEAARPTAPSFTEVRVPPA
jgi:hypothetical protein